MTIWIPFFCFVLFFFDISPAIHDMMGWYGMVWDGIDGLIWNIWQRGQRNKEYPFFFRLFSFSFSFSFFFHDFHSVTADNFLFS